MLDSRGVQFNIENDRDLSAFEIWAQVLVSMEACDARAF
jgi:hypothetical protein